MQDKILVLIKEDSIIVAQNGKKLIINSDNPMFEELKTQTKEQIKEWYINRK